MRLIDPAREGHPIGEPESRGASTEFIDRTPAGERRAPWQRGQRRATNACRSSGTPLRALR